MANLNRRPGDGFSGEPINSRSAGVGRRILIPASNYYVLSVALTTGFFFVVWGLLHDAGEELPWVTAGIGASILLCGAVILREVVLRHARYRAAQQHSGMDIRFRSGFISGRHSPNKLTLEKNAAILGDIKQKSNAAKVLDKFSSGHREVFELCREYLLRNESELKTVNAGSPRLAALLKGRAVASDFHRYHLLRWAEIESRTWTAEAKNQVNAEDRFLAANNAISVIETALEAYPTETSLLQSHDLLREMAVLIKVSDIVEEAERAAFKDEYAEAKSLYRDALFYLGRDNVQSPEREVAARRINDAIDRLRSADR
jgi:hypothetical protein